MELKQKLTAEMNRVIDFMSKLDPDNENYTVIVQNLKNLSEIRAKKPAFPIDPEVLFTTGAVLVELVLVIRHEQFNVITSKAFGWVRPK